jgi:hypothetical protein
VRGEALQPVDDFGHADGSLDEQMLVVGHVSDRQLTPEESRTANSENLFRRLKATLPQA